MIWVHPCITILSDATDITIFNMFYRLTSNFPLGNILFHEELQVLPFILENTQKCAVALLLIYNLSK